MVAIIRSSGSVKRCAQYNENKVKAGQAECIMAGNYPCEANELTAKQRVHVLHKRLALNARCKKSTLHIVLSFHAGDQLSIPKLKRISQAYMDQIGMGEQPYLVYQHLDMLHPHVHIVTVTIKADGAGIQAFPTRLALANNVIGYIEKQFQLTKAAGRDLKEQNAESAQKLQYGKMQAMQSVSQVLSVVLPHFKYRSLLELNAVLRHYNLVAKTGRPGSKIHRHNGLVYQMLSDDGRKTGVPIKASDIAGKPTLSHLHQRFKVNSAHLAQPDQRVKALIDLAARSAEKPSFSELTARLSADGVKPVFALSPSGMLEEIIFVDFRTRWTFSASRLGGQYQPARMMERFTGFTTAIQPQDALYPTPLPGRLPAKANVHQATDPQGKGYMAGANEDESLLKLVMMPESKDDYLPRELKKRPKKKSRQISIHL